MLVAPLQPARAVAAPAHPVAVVAPIEVAESVIDLRAPASTVNLTPPQPSAASASVDSDPGTASRTVTVERHDSYWAIVERESGRWLALAGGPGPERRSHHDGRPCDRHRRRAAAGRMGARPARRWPDRWRGTRTRFVLYRDQVVVEPGDNLWDMSEDRLADDLDREPTDPETVPYWRDVMTANHDRLVDPANPSLIHPGQVLVLPPTGHADAPTVEPAPAPAEPIPEVPPPAPEPPTTTPSTTAPSTTAPSTASPTTSPPTTATIPAAATDASATAGEVTPVDSGGSDDESNAVPVWLTLGGLTSVAMAVGAKRLIQKRRREFALDHDGAELPTPDPEDRQLHQAMVAQADEELIEELQYALGELAVALAESGARCRPRLCTALGRQPRSTARQADPRRCPARMAVRRGRCRLVARSCHQRRD